MRVPRIGAGEEARLAALHDFDPLSGETDAQLDEVVSLASRLFDVPIALVSLVARDRQVFAGRTGLQACETSRDVSFCAHELESQGVLVVLDAKLDIRFASNPLVTDDPNIRFYAGAPLHTASGQVLGRLCIIDRKPRNHFSDRDKQSLEDLARLAVDRLERRRLVLAGQIGQSRFRNIAATSPDPIVCADHEGLITFWNATAEQLFGYSADEAVGPSLELIVPETMRGTHSTGLKRAAQGRKPHLVGSTIELEALRKDGATFPIELSLSMWKEGEATSFGAIMRDISARRRHDDHLFHLAHHDVLTGLPNRGVVAGRITEAIERGDPAHLLVIDLDGFKNVNDTLGHDAGDMLLKHVASRLQNCVRSTDTVARLGGDEFAVLLDGMADNAAATITAESAIASLSTPFLLDGQLVRISASVGIVATSHSAADADMLLSNADLAMYQAKREGSGCTRFYSEHLREEVVRRRAFEGELRRAIDEDEFVLFYQPQVDLKAGRLIGAEALIRWQHPSRGLLTPGEFLPALEHSALAVEVGRWTLETACAAASAWRKHVPDFQIGVNLFEAQFGRGRHLPSRSRRSVRPRTSL